MSNPERDPDELTCAPGAGGAVSVLAPREVPLGGPRAMTVRRTLPARGRSLIGAWCFVDHYGPDPVAATGGMSVAPHPHAGLATVSWLFSGEIEHRDSAGHHAMVRPGELNLMSAGHGISHSEVSTAATDMLHGVQLWVALPSGARDGDRAFTHHAPDACSGPGWTARVFLGSLLGQTSPVPTATPLLGAELVLDPGARLGLDVDAAFEHGVLVDAGTLTVAGTPTATHDLVHVPPGVTTLDLVVDPASEAPARVLLLGGPPFGEEIVMWWNFVGRSHDEVVEMRRQWQEQLTDGDRDGDRDGNWDGEGGTPRLRDGRFGVPVDDPLPPIPAPALPHARLRTRH